MTEQRHSYYPSDDTWVPLGILRSTQWRFTSDVTNSGYFATSTTFRPRTRSGIRDLPFRRWMDDARLTTGQLALRCIGHFTLKNSTTRRACKDKTRPKNADNFPGYRSKALNNSHTEFKCRANTENNPQSSLENDHKAIASQYTKVAFGFSKG